MTMYANGLYSLSKPFFSSSPESHGINYTGNTYLLQPFHFTEAETEVQELVTKLGHRSFDS